jgi:hypothetical protein
MVPSVNATRTVISPACSTVTDAASSLLSVLRVVTSPTVASVNVAACSFTASAGVVVSAAGGRRSRFAASPC